jgi:endoglucanase
VISLLHVAGRAPRSAKGWLSLVAVSCLVCAGLAGLAAAVSLIHPGVAAAPRAVNPDTPGVFLRVNQLGYEPGQTKSAIAFSSEPLAGAFQVVTDSGAAPVYEGTARPPRVQAWGRFPHHVELDFTAVREPGLYRLTFAGAASSAFHIGAHAYRDIPDQLLEFMRQQRCGFNPFLDTICHPFDGRTASGPMPDGSYLDARGGWHDAGDSLKYLLTASNAVAQMLVAYRLAPGIFGDRVNQLGQGLPNGQADVLDEARWGLEWMLRLHPAPGQLFHQVADDRDHSGWRLPQNDASDYGWGKGSYRVVYFATGKPQGIGRYQSDSTGVANLAGRYAAAMALAYQAWSKDAANRPFADRCLRAGIEVYRLGTLKEGVQQGNSYGAPYRYVEDTWADDMEWGAAELYRATREPRYLADAKRYAEIIGSTSWMGRESIGHYQFYPFLNLGHFALHGVAADSALRKRLAGFYAEGLQGALDRGRSNPYLFGAPFAWCSNNLVVALVTQGLLYERMSGDGRYRQLAAANRDWLLGRNPWGTSMFTLIPEGGVFPRFPHLITADLTGRPVRGGLVDGPVTEAIFRGLKGVALSRADAFAPFQSEQAVYHDDLQDYSSNEPTMDGTASAIMLMAMMAR